MGTHQQLNTVSWRNRTLRPYESMGSLGAKYCYVNRVNPHRFTQFLKEYLPQEVEAAPVVDSVISIDRIDISHIVRFSRQITLLKDVPFSAVDVEGFKIRDFAQVLNEPIAIVRSQRSSLFELGASLTKIASVSSGLRVEALYVCPVCISEGYHSTLHQLSWLERCYLHDVVLERISHPPRPLKMGLPRDCSLVSPLYKVWFGNSSPWPDAKRRFWPQESDRSKYGVVRKLIQELKRVDQFISRTEPHSGLKPVIRGSTDSERLWLGIRATEHRCCVAKKLLAPSEPSYERGRVIKATHAQAALILDRQFLDLKVLLQARILTCELLDESPPWRKYLQRYLVRLVSKHRTCAREFAGVFSGWNSVKIPKTSLSACVLLPALDLAEIGWIPCPSLVLIDLLHELTSAYSIIDEQRGSGGFWGFYSEKKGLEAGLLRSITGRLNNYSHPVFTEQRGSEFGPYDLHRSSRYVRTREARMISPTGPLNDVIDEILLATIRSWVSALNRIEPDLRSGKIGRNNIWPKFSNFMKEYEPAYLIKPHVKGVELRIIENAPCRHATPKLDRRHDAKVKSILTLAEKACQRGNRFVSGVSYDDIEMHSMTPESVVSIR